jgi:putative transposase
MRGPKPLTVTLTDEERTELARLARRPTTAQRLAQRARIVLAAATGANNEQIARQLGVNINVVRKWRGRWVGLQAASLARLPLEERLTDVPRPGRPRQITAEQECQIVALACERPAEGGRPISQWTGREVADEVVRRGILPQLSPRHAARLLKRGTSNRTASAPG